MTHVQAQGGIPIPPIYPGHQVYPTQTMQVGESFLHRSSKRRSVVKYVAAVNARLAPKQFAWRETTLVGEFRIWRIT